MKQQPCLHSSVCAELASESPYFLKRVEAFLARSITSWAVPSCQTGAFHSFE